MSEFNLEKGSSFNLSKEAPMSKKSNEEKIQILQKRLQEIGQKQLEKNILSGLSQSQLVHLLITYQQSIFLPYYITYKKPCLLPWVELVYKNALESNLRLNQT